MRRLMVPLAILGLAVVVGSGGIDHGLGSDRLLTATRGSLLAALLLALHFRRGRLTMMALLAAGLGELGRSLPAVSASLGLGATGAESLVALVTMLLPIELVLLALLGEWHPISRAGALRSGLLVFPLALGAWWVSAVDRGIPRALDLVGVLRSPFLPAPIPAETPLPHTACLLFAVALGVAGWRFARRRTPFEAALLATIPALAAAAAAVARIGRAVSSGTSPALEGLQIAILATGIVLVVGLLQGAFALAFEDGLTGLPARRALEENLRQLGRTYAIAMVDIDHFKKLNDRHGHEVGDQVLRMVGALLARATGGCSAYRYGGEEFTLLFPGKTATEAEPHAEALRATIAERRFAVRSPDRPKKRPKSQRSHRTSTRKELRVTVSIGIADRQGERSRPEEVMKAADKALYRAKRAGRNRVTRTP